MKNEIKSSLKCVLPIALTFLLLSIGQSQDQFTQTVKGNIIDKESKAPIIGATIVFPDLQPIKGTSTNESGFFKIENVPVGRYRIQVSYTGYESVTIPEILVGSGKEVFLTIELKESITQMDEVVVKSQTSKGASMNSMATVSSRSFNVEEAIRYAGGLDDPSRLASAFAGVSTDGNVENNAIMIRGNSPTGVLWQIDGVETPVPSHFANAEVLGGGGITMFSNQMLSNSDFYTGAFPAEFGNASSGVFNIKLRNGNDEKHEHAIQVGILGLDISSEGPFKKGNQSSYLFNYRYSTMGLVSQFLPDEGLPKYQDLCFKINIPTKKAGTFSFWGIGGISNFFVDAQKDSTQWKNLDDRQKVNSNFIQGTTALTHKYFWGNHTYIQTSLALSSYNQDTKDEILDGNMNFYLNNHPIYRDDRYTFKSVINHKFNAKFSNRTGLILNLLDYKYSIKAGGQNINEFEVANSRGSTSMMQFFTQSKYDFNENLSLNAGVHMLYFDLNQKYSIEPRLGLKWQVDSRNSFSLAYGIHSQTQFMSLYFIKREFENKSVLPNKELDFTRSQHFVLGYDFMLNDNIRIKVEPYYQILKKIPIVSGTAIAIINVPHFHEFNDVLESTGKGRNYGVDVTFERFLNKGFYYLATASLFQSKYTAPDGIERNTMYNNNYVVNLLAGKEWKMNSKNIIGLSGRLYLKGGNRISPINTLESISEKDIVLDETRPMEDQEPAFYRFDISAYFRINKAGMSHVVSAQINNLLFSPTYNDRYYNYTNNSITKEQIGFPFPSINWKVEF